MGHPVLRARARRARLRNIKPVLVTQADPGLPEGQVDLILMVDVYHEVSDPEATLRGLRKALKPGGRLVLVEFRAEDPTVPIKPEHKMTVEQARKEIEPQGFSLQEVLDFLPWQHILIFQKPPEPAPAATHMAYIDLSRVDLRAATGPSVSAACQLCSGVAAMEVVKILTGRGRVEAAALGVD